MLYLNKMYRLYRKMTINDHSLSIHFCLDTYGHFWTFFLNWTFFFFLKISFKIGMSRRAGRQASGVVRGLPFWLTFFQSCMLPLFFSGLLSYLVGMKRRTRRCVTCKRDNSHFLRYVLISPDIRGLPFG